MFSLCVSFAKGEWFVFSRLPFTCFHSERFLRLPFIYIKPYTLLSLYSDFPWEAKTYLDNLSHSYTLPSCSESSFVMLFCAEALDAFRTGFYWPIGLYLPFCTYSIAQKKRNCNMANCKNLTICFCLIRRKLPIITIFSLQSGHKCDIINLWACFTGAFFV